MNKKQLYKRLYTKQGKTEKYQKYVLKYRICFIVTTASSWMCFTPVIYSLRSGCNHQGTSWSGKLIFGYVTTYVCIIQYKYSLEVLFVIDAQPSPLVLMFYRRGGSFYKIGLDNNNVLQHFNYFKPTQTNIHHQLLIQLLLYVKIEPICVMSMVDNTYCSLNTQIRYEWQTYREIYHIVNRTHLIIELMRTNDLQLIHRYMRVLLQLPVLNMRYNRSQLAQHLRNPVAEAKYLERDC
ncbi:Hypothetical_protein [Hexamita inflata]|uniref:Hypothetical_protein n=1 Tax=Hexamita inflata TaxID=28002 RepID=A0AA86Q9A2_9EUKA|nr:Hypothetical protein HINF_LOCUS42306 [Hexamita inflata]